MNSKTNRKTHTWVKVHCLFLLMLGCSRQPPPSWVTFDNAGVIENRSIPVKDLAIQSICKQDKYIWFGLPEGLVRYDGKKWRGYNNHDGIPGRIIWHLAEQGDTLLWIAAEDGIAALYKGSILNDTAANKIVHDATCVFPEPGRLYIGTDHGLYVTKPKVHVDTLWVQSIEQIALPKDTGVGANNVRSIQRDPDTGFLWVGTYHGLVHFTGKGKPRRFTEKDGLPSNIIYDILLADQAIWVSTTLGIAQLSQQKGKVLRILNKENGIISSFTTCMDIQENVLWIGTIEGVCSYHLKSNATRAFSVQDGLANDAVRSVLVDQSDVWFGCLIGGVSRYRGEI